MRSVRRSRRYRRVTSIAGIQSDEDVHQSAVLVVIRSLTWANRLVCLHNQEEVMSSEEGKESASKERRKGDVKLVLRRPADTSDEALRKLAREMVKALKGKSDTEPEDKGEDTQSQGNS